MSENTKDILNELDDSYDVLEDVQDDDFVFVLTNTGHLKGISFPVDMADEAEIDPNIEEMISFLVKKYAETRPAGTTLH